MEAADRGGPVLPDTSPGHRRLQRTSSGRILTESTFGNGPTPDGVVCAGTPPTRRPHRPRSVPGPRLVRGCRGDASGHHRLSARVLVPSGNVSLGRDPGAPHLEALAATNAASRFSTSRDNTIIERVCVTNGSARSRSSTCSRCGMSAVRRCTSASASPDTV